MPRQPLMQSKLPSRMPLCWATRTQQPKFAWWPTLRSPVSAAHSNSGSTAPGSRSRFSAASSPQLSKGTVHLVVSCLQFICLSSIFVLFSRVACFMSLLTIVLSSLPFRALQTATLPEKSAICSSSRSSPRTSGTCLVSPTMLQMPFHEQLSRPLLTTRLSPWPTLLPHKPTMPSCADFSSMGLPACSCPGSLVWPPLPNWSSTPAPALLDRLSQLFFVAEYSTLFIVYLIPAFVQPSDWSAHDLSGHVCSVTSASGPELVIRVSARRLAATPPLLLAPFRYPTRAFSTSTWILWAHFPRLLASATC